MSDQEKVRTNRGGATVLQCESGNPDLGVMITPCDDGLIIALPTGEEPRSALDSVAVHLGPEQCAVLRDLAQAAYMGTVGK